MTAKTMARYLHLTQAARSAGEAFACPAGQDEGGRLLRWPHRFALACTSAGLIAAVLLLSF